MCTTYRNTKVSPDFGRNCERFAKSTNHFDFGEERLRELTAQTDFPWLLSNAFHAASHNAFGSSHDRANSPSPLLASAQRYHIVTLQGFRVGFFGLAGTDWPSNCRELPRCVTEDPVQSARACTRHLRCVAACDLVIAVTHMRLAQDMELSEARCGDAADPAERLDLVLGGHDHQLLRRYGGDIGRYSYRAKDPKVLDCSHPDAATLDLVDNTNGMVLKARGTVRVVKSGTDWGGLSCVTLQVDRRAATGSSDGAAETVLQSVIVEQIADISHATVEDQAMLEDSRRRVSECLRSVHQQIDVIGADALVHTAVPLQGVEPPLTVVADWLRREGSRILEVWQCPRPCVQRSIRPGDNDKLTVAMVAFIADGFDGYGYFRDQETLVSEEAGVTDTQLLLRTLGYQYDRQGGTKEVHDDAVEVDELRFKRAKMTITKCEDLLKQISLNRIKDGLDRSLKRVKEVKGFYFIAITYSTY
ncbi:Metallo-dependent phosphatase [Colletotrichum eremochloae]|nr:Metallo-dependent phosphatase [Colletotrichum eremochloae]